jgi:hypothetical protein
LLSAILRHPRQSNPLRRALLNRGPAPRKPRAWKGKIRTRHTRRLKTKRIRDFRNRHIKIWAVGYLWKQEPPRTTEHRDTLLAATRTRTPPIRFSQAVNPLLHTRGVRVNKGGADPCCKQSADIYSESSNIGTPSRCKVEGIQKSLRGGGAEDCYLILTSGVK